MLTNRWFLPVFGFKLIKRTHTFCIKPNNLDILPAGFKHGTLVIKLLLQGKPNLLYIHEQAFLPQITASDKVK